MANNDFSYNEELHQGTWKGKVIPSITRLVGLVYPMGNIPTDTLQKASEYGTYIHSDIELWCKGIDEPKTQECQNFATFVNLLGYKITASEKMVFIWDRECENIIAYGTLDLLFKDTDGNTILGDIKTISQFDNEKVALQLSMYALGLSYEDIEINKAIGIWLRNKNEDNIAQIRPLNLLSIQETYNLVLSLCEKWEEREKRI